MLLVLHPSFWKSAKWVAGRPVRRRTAGPEVTVVHTRHPLPASRRRTSVSSGSDRQAGLEGPVLGEVVDVAAPAVYRRLR